MNRARFTKQARIELLAQTKYYETVRTGLGARFRSEVEAAGQRAAAFPLHGKPSVDDTRRRLVAGFPFSLFYTAEEYGVLIHAVASHRLPPNFWVSRLEGDDG